VQFDPASLTRIAYHDHTLVTTISRLSADLQRLGAWRKCIGRWPQTLSIAWPNIPDTTIALASCLRRTTVSIKTHSRSDGST